MDFITNTTTFNRPRRGPTALTAFKTTAEDERSMYASAMNIYIFFRACYKSVLYII